MTNIGNKYQKLFIYVGPFVFYMVLLGEDFTHVPWEQSHLSEPFINSCQYECKFRLPSVLHAQWQRQYAFIHVYKTKA